MFLRAGLGRLLEATVVVSTLVSILAAVYVARAEPLPPSRARRSRAISVLAHPFAQLLVVVALLFANQTAFDAWIVTAHHGSVAFLHRYVGPAWFAIAKDDALVRLVAAHAGDGHLLAPSLFRVQAFLELPFTLFAYLSVARLLGVGLYRTLVRPLPLLLASLSFSFTFSIIEVLVWNPWTTDDLALRALSALLTPAWVVLAARLEGRVDERRPTGVLGLVAFLAGAGGVAYLVLAAYDALLLYNLAHLPRYAVGGALAIAVVLAASWAAPRADALVARVGGAGAARSPSPSPSPAIDAIVSSLSTFTHLFFVPSLAIRYWGGHAAANAAGVLLAGVSACAGVAGAARRAGLAAAPRLVAVSFVGVGCGAVAAWLAYAPQAALPELALARVSLAFLAAGIVSARAAERVFWPPHEAKAPADQA